MTPESTHSGRYIDDQAPDAERTYALFNHLVGLLGLTPGINVLALVAAIVMWRVKHAASPYLDDHGRESTNFQISLLIYTMAAFPLGLLSLGLAIPLLWAGVIALTLAGCIRGAMAAHRGEYYRYPMCIRFIK